MSNHQTVNLNDSVQTDLFELFEQMHTNDHPLSDIRIELIDGRHLYAHSWILRFRSKYFQQMLDCQLKESRTGIIRIEDEPYLIEQLLRYLYLGQVQFNNLQQLLCLCLTADKYLANRMYESLFEQIQSKWLNEFTAISIYRFGQHYEHDNLITISFNFILKNGYKFLSNRSLIDLSPQQLISILSNDQFNCIENDLFDFILAYLSYNNCNNHNQNHSNNRIQIRTFEVTNVPENFLLNLTNIGIQTVSIDLNTDEYDNTDNRCDHNHHKISQTDQELLIQCIRPNAIINLDQTLKSLSLIYDNHLLKCCSEQFNIDNKATNLRQCYPNYKQNYYIDKQSYLIKFNTNKYLNKLIIKYSNVLNVWKSSDQQQLNPTITFEYKSDNNDDEDWYKISTKTVNILNQKTIEYHLNRIILANCIRIFECDRFIAYTPILAKIDLIGNDKC